mgnify:CR=1 FL=1
MHVNQNLTRAHKQAVSECLQDMKLLQEFCGREDGTLNYRQVEQNYGRDVAISCCVNGWLSVKWTNFALTTSEESPCWITEKGHLALQNKLNV